TPGTKVDEISGTIEDVIRSYGCQPVSNLTGHGLGQWEGHAEPTIHNVRTGNRYVLQEGDVIAVEPFATNGSGRIKDSEPSVIFSLVNMKPVRSAGARKIIRDIEAFNGLPFAERWLGSSFKTRLAMRELKQSGALYEYPVLKEVSKGIVAQAEHTVVVKETPIITTKL
ncbi:MAG: M24 family metallopeptidase, partial [Candidatus Aenigmarchaeota archaeon]|nr:M24 family metallopeptidase [Candidatus Aenigmarchaeota archaeon]